MSNKTGGQAFPSNVESEFNGYAYSGMTLRDYFAAKAMQCYMDDVIWNVAIYEAAAKASYAVADAMLRAREA